MAPIWGRQDPGGSHVGPMNFATWGPYFYLTVIVTPWPRQHLSSSHILHIDYQRGWFLKSILHVEILGGNQNHVLSTHQTCVILSLFQLITFSCLVLMMIVEWIDPGLTPQMIWSLSFCDASLHSISAKVGKLHVWHSMLSHINDDCILPCARVQVWVRVGVPWGPSVQLGIPWGPGVQLGVPWGPSVQLGVPWGPSVQVGVPKGPSG